MFCGGSVGQQPVEVPCNKGLKRLARMLLAYIHNDKTVTILARLLS